MSLLLNIIEVMLKKKPLTYHLNTVIQHCKIYMFSNNLISKYYSLKISFTYLPQLIKLLLEIQFNKYFNKIKSSGLILNIN